MKCQKCQHENETDAKFCEECAAPLRRACSNCGRQLSPKAKFCPECAHPTDLAPATHAADRFASPENYTPKHLAERILTSKTALEGERKQVTVLFADVKGSMELLADRDPEETRKLLDPILEHMMEAVHRYEGTVNQVMGDGIMALFGAPISHEDHAVRACYAALRMQEAVKRYAEGVRRIEGIPIQIRVGLNSGEVVVRSIGSDLRMDYSAVGQTTNVAARMEQMSVPGSILMSADTLLLAEGYVQVKPLGPLRVRGLEQPLEVFEIVGATAVRSRLHAAAGRGLTRFVGRDGEMDQLHQALERAGEGQGQVVAVVGEPGVGKSRLYWEFVRSHRTGGWLLLESSSVSYGKATAFLPIIDLLRAYFQLESADEPRKVREKITGKLLSLDRALEPSLSPLLWLLDVPVDDAQWQRLDPPQRRLRALDAVKRLILRESQVQPLVVIFEDLHWIDAETQALLDALVESLPTAHILLLVNYRPEYQHTWGNKSYYRQLSIAPLRPDSAEELLAALLGNERGLQPLKQMLIERTDGNPFFLEESVRTLVETKALVGAPGAYHLGKSSQALQIPTTAQAILAARIDRLEPEHKRLLQAASVIGKDVPFALLQEIAELSEESLRQGVAHLQGAEFLYEARLFPDLEYTFKHALTHGVAYGSVLSDRRRNLHGRIMMAIERLYPDRLREFVDQLAQHAFRGEEWAKAVAYHHQAGAEAFARSANRDAITHFEQALTALQHLPESQLKVEQAIDIRCDLRNALFPLAEVARIDGYLREAEGFARALHDQRRLGLVSLLMSHNSLISGHTSEATEFASKAQTIAVNSQDVGLEISAGVYLGAAHVAAGALTQSEAPLRGVLTMLQGDLVRKRFSMAGYPAVMARFYLIWALAERGVFSEGATQGAEAIRIAETLDHPYTLSAACYRLGFLYSVKGEFDRATELLQRCQVVTSEYNIPLFSAISTECLGNVRVLTGRIEEGTSLLQSAIAALEGMGVTQYQLLGMLHLSEAYLAANCPDDAAPLAERVLKMSRERGNRGYEAWVLRLLAELSTRVAQPDLASAETLFGDAFALATELDMRPLIAHCRLGLSKLHTIAGEHLKAEDHLAKAAEMYRDMDMQFWLKQAQMKASSAR